MRCVIDGADASNAALLAHARADMAELLGITAQPELVRVRRLERALPIQELGCGGRPEHIQQEVAALARFALAGNGHGAVGVPDCLESGHRAGERVARQLLAQA